MKPACSNCSHWDGSPETKSGFCRADLPGRDQYGLGAWPRVYANEWCGKFAPPLVAPTQQGLAE